VRTLSTRNGGDAREGVASTLRATKVTLSGMESRSAGDVPPRAAAAARELKARVGDRFGGRLLELRLFGSYARGDWGADSDVDVLVVVDGLTHAERREVSDLAEDVYFQTLVRVSPLALSGDEMHTLRAREYLIATEIARDGVPV
jgi:predicted nucleotidyltransferase